MVSRPDPLDQDRAELRVVGQQLGRTRASPRAQGLDLVSSLVPRARGA